MKPLVKNTLIYTIGGLLHPLLNFLLLPVYTAYLNPEEFGIIASMYALIALLTIFYSLTLDRALLRIYWDYETEQERKEFLSTIFIAILGICIIMSIISILLSSQIQSLFLEERMNTFYFIALFMSIEKIFLNLVQSVHRIKENAKAFVILNLSNFIAKIILIITFLVILDKGLAGYFFASVINSAIFFIIYILAIRNWFIPRFKISYFRTAFRFAIPYLPGTSGSWIIGQSDKVFISTLISFSDLGIYAISLRISQIITLINTSFKNAYFPHFFKTMSENVSAKSRHHLAKYNNAYIQLMLLIGFAISLFSKEVILLFVDSKYYDAHYYIPILILSSLVFSFSSTLLGASLQQNKKTITDSLLGITTSILTLGLNYTLIKKYGLYGAMYTQLISSIFHFAIGYLLVKKESSFIPFNIFLTIIMISLYAIIIVVLNNLNMGLHLAIAVKALIVITISLILYFFIQPQIVHK